MSQFLSTSIEFLKGVGPNRADLLKTELGIFTFGHLLNYFPFRYVDKSNFSSIRSVDPNSNAVQIKGKIQSVRTIGQKRATRLVAKFADETGTIDLVWFKGIKWIKPNLKLGVDYVIYGKPTLYGSTFNVVHPEIEKLEDFKKSVVGELEPVYSTTEKAANSGLNSKGIEKLTKALVQQMKNPYVETLSEEVLSQVRLINKNTAIKNVHFPQDAAILQQARNRLKFEELFFVQLGLLKMKVDHQKEIRGFVFDKIGEQFNGFYNNHLPFELTNAQKRVVKEVRADMGSGRHMNRLLQGDVGSGKTIVALLVMLIALDNNFQACLMAPTEILATQHYEGLSELLADTNIEVALLTGSTKTAARKGLHAKLESGELNILIGTHALIEDKVKYKNLGLVAIDEQHRFGVAQRAKLWKKGQHDEQGRLIPPHVLVMTATPIPRTLAMTFYGDLDVSVIDELPPGRKPIKTIHKFDSNRLSVWGLAHQEIQKGRQVYIVYPLIKESETLDYKDLMDGYESVRRDFPEQQISIVHGQMKPEDKEAEMQRFLNKKTQIMVATTVIEVGVNVPNASVMIIESAERFGLSQLHQLRGRVGRGAEQSYCLLVTSYKLSADAKTRMETMVKTNDGFEISEVDLKLRGPGDIVGTQQSGMLDLKIADLVRDGQILQLARNTANVLLDEDPELTLPKNALIAREYNRTQKGRMDWGRIS